jgi:hypothetical protein
MAQSHASAPDMDTIGINREVNIRQVYGTFSIDEDFYQDAVIVPNPQSKCRQFIYNNIGYIILMILIVSGWMILLAALIYKAYYE